MYRLIQGCQKLWCVEKVLQVLSRILLHRCQKSEFVAVVRAPYWKIFGWEWNLVFEYFWLWVKFWCQTNLERPFAFSPATDRKLIPPPHSDNNSFPAAYTGNSTSIKALNMGRKSRFDRRNKGSSYPPQNWNPPPQ